jgi:Protein of unknown function (DUF3047)
MEIVTFLRGLGITALCCTAGGFFTHTVSADSAPEELRLDVSQWRVVERESGPTNYYKVVTDASPPFIRALYHPPYETTVLGIQVSDADRTRVKRLRWSWRALTLPKDGDECADGKQDSAAVVYATWRHTLRWYSIKYVWSSVGTKGAVCDQKRNPFLAQDTVILESGGPLNTWKTESIDLKSEFRKHFENGDPNAEVPDFLGLGIMSDGDQTKSDSSADYAEFILTR